MMTTILTCNIPLRYLFGINGDDGRTTDVVVVVVDMCAHSLADKIRGFAINACLATTKMTTGNFTPIREREVCIIQWNPVPYKEGVSSSCNR